MEAVAANPGCFIPPRNRDHLSHPWEVVMEGGIEASHLRQIGFEMQERLDRSDLAGQVIGVVGDDLTQLIEDRGGDELRSPEAVASVDDAMTDDGDVVQTDHVSEKLDQQAHGRWLIRDRDGVILLLAAVGALHDQP